MGLFKFENIFEKPFKYDAWLSIIKSSMKFFSERKLIEGNVPLKTIDSLKFGAYEVLGVLSEEKREFEVFLEIVASKTSFLRDSTIFSLFQKKTFEDIYVAIVIKHANDLMLEACKDSLLRVRELAEKYKRTVHIGRTHGVHAEPTSFGYTFACCYDDFFMCLEELIFMRRYLEIVTFDYSIFHDSSLTIDLQEHLAFDLGLNNRFSHFTDFPIGKYSSYLSILNSISQVMNKLSSDLHLLSFEEVGEVEFDDEVKEASENLSIFSKSLDSFGNLLGGLASSGENRDSDSFRNKVRENLFLGIRTFFDSLDCFNVIINKVVIRDDVMKKNIEESNGDIYSQAALLYVIKNADYSRQEVMNDMKEITSSLPNYPGSFQEALVDSKYGNLFTKGKVNKILNAENYLVHVDEMYDRVFGRVDANGKNKYRFTEEEFNRMVEGLSDKLNSYYRGLKETVLVMSFSQQSCLFLGKILPLLNFNLIVKSFPNIEKTSDLKNEDFVKIKELFESRVLVIDYLLDRFTFLGEFKMIAERRFFVRDWKVCAFFETTDAKTRVKSDWSAVICDAISEDERSMFRVPNFP